MKKLSEQKPARLQLVITHEEIEDIDSYQHQNKIYGRSAAIRKLVQIGLATEREAGNWFSEKP